MEKNLVVTTGQPLYLKVIAKIISYIFHPLFIPTYVFLWLALRFPFEVCRHYTDRIDAAQNLCILDHCIFPGIFSFSFVAFKIY